MALRASVSDSVTRVQASFTIVVRPVGSGPGSETKAADRTLLSVIFLPDGSPALRVEGPAGATFRVESTDLLGSPWETLEAIGPIRTLGEREPVEVPLPTTDPGSFRRFRLRRP